MSRMNLLLTEYQADQPTAYQEGSTVRMALHGRTLVFMLVGLNCIATSLQQSYIGNGYFQGYELKDMNVKKKEEIAVNLIRHNFIVKTARTSITSLIYERFTA
ncbi:hypothetical protein HELRODRAFT_161544 [Helobdella robusta]|uniref:Uncharacterized protein n=1 Tax=Helobdella robusta TaxID=6412 RepID=T1ERL8_HELRO|nr:hypothetical protein HELRODRAFT_161544 [Helobdella robusta]ESO02292.1 hypothetical protein HELRODRAFT_161544 [Helobdella robusta]